LVLALGRVLLVRRRRLVLALRRRVVAALRGRGVEVLRGALLVLLVRRGVIVPLLLL
jgi:hypothetical protein